MTKMKHYQKALDLMTNSCNEEAILQSTVRGGNARFQYRTRCNILSIWGAIMNATRKGNHDILEYLGLDVLRQLEDMRSKGVRRVNIVDVAAATPTALQAWDDTNFPYSLPTELRAFLGASDGFSLTWTAQHLHPDATARDSLDVEVLVGKIRINSLAAIKRLPLDSDDLRGIASSRARAAAATAASSSSKEELPRRFSSHSTRDIRTEASSSSAPLGGSGGSKTYGLAAFSLDSLCEVGAVALVYGGAPLKRSYLRQCAGTDKLKGASVAELTNPEIWLQDLSCRWHFLADSFTSYFRMMAVHLGVLGWQQAFSPVGLSPNTKQCMRLYCPDRLLLDQLEWQKEKTITKTGREAAANSKVET